MTPLTGQLSVQQLFDVRETITYKTRFAKLDDYAILL